MSARMYESPRPLTPTLQAKLKRVEARLTKKRRTQRIRIALQNIIDQLQRDREARRSASCGGGQHVPGLLVEVLDLATDFEVLMEEVG